MNVHVLRATESKKVIFGVRRLRLLPGVTTLSRDFYRRPILGASNHFYLYLFIAWNLSLLE